jgi:hypothetical protein
MVKVEDKALVVVAVDLLVQVKDQLKEPMVILDQVDPVLC